MTCTQPGCANTPANTPAAAADARAAFDAVFSALPGEVAPTLALAFAAEAAGDLAAAGHYVRLVWDPS